MFLSATLHAAVYFKVNEQKTLNKNSDIMIYSLIYTVLMVVSWSVLGDKYKYVFTDVFLLYQQNCNIRVLHK